MEPTYNLTQCCYASGLLPQCMALCSYDLKMSDMQALGATCQAQMGKKIKQLKTFYTILPSCKSCSRPKTIVRKRNILLCPPMHSLILLSFSNRISPGLIVFYLQVSWRDAQQVVGTTRPAVIDVESFQHVFPYVAV